jgi:hypothetical protein
VRINKLKFLTIKMFSLMKKQFFTLVMMLAIVVLAGTSAMAQIGIPTSADTHFTGSTHTYTVADHSAIGNTYAWAILTASGSPTLVSGAAADASHYSITGGNTSNAFTFEWTPAASGYYSIQVTESNESTRNSCSTVRQYFVLVIDFDLHLFASTSAGVEISAAADLATCGSNGDYNPWFNNETDLTDNRTEGDGSAANPYSVRYVTATLTSSTGIDLASVDYRWYFPYTITGGDDNYDVSIVPYNHTAAVTVVNTTFNSGNVTVELESGATVASVTFEIRYQPKWANDESDILLTMSNAQNTCKLDGIDTDLLFDDGTESTANYGTTPGSADPLSNQTRQQTIYVSPATSTITLSE